MITTPTLWTIRVVNATLGTCACCDCECSMVSLAPVEKDYTYTQAVREYSFERDDLVCSGCRRDFEATYGRAADDVYHVYDRGHDRND